MHASGGAEDGEADGGEAPSCALRHGQRSDAPSEAMSGGRASNRASEGPPEAELGRELGHERSHEGSHEGAEARLRPRSAEARSASLELITNH